MSEIYFPVSIAGLDEYLYCMETLISADPSKIPLLGDALVIAGSPGQFVLHLVMFGIDISSF